RPTPVRRRSPAGTVATAPQEPGEVGRAFIAARRPAPRDRRAVLSTRAGLLGAIRSRRGRASHRAALGDRVPRGEGGTDRAPSRGPGGAHAEPRRRTEGRRRGVGSVEVAPMSPADVSEARTRFVQKITRLHLWYVRQLLVRGEIRAASVPAALTRRVNIY